MTCEAKLKKNEMLVGSHLRDPHYRLIQNGGRSKGGNDNFMNIFADTVVAEQESTTWQHANIYYVLLYLSA